jgi:hypothetical protein
MARATLDRALPRSVAWRGTSVRIAKLVVAGSLIVVLGACSSSSTPAPAGGGGGGTSGGGSGAGVGASVAATSDTSGGGAGVSSAAGGGTGGGTTDTTGLDATPTAKMCALLSTDEAQTILGKTLSQPPDGLSMAGLGTNCIYQTDANMTDGTYIKVEINTLPYTGNVGLLFFGAQPTTFSVGGFDASGIDKGTGGSLQGVMTVKLSGGAKDPSMVIQAPTLDAAKAVAEKVLGRLNTLH